MPPQQRYLGDWITFPERILAPEPDAATSLDPLETPVSEKIADLKSDNWSIRDNIIESFRHSGWKEERRRRADALRTAFGTGYALMSYIQCGGTHWILRSKNSPETFRRVADTCKSPWCKPCYRSRGLLIRDRLKAELPDTPVRFVTLTLRSNDHGLRWNLDRLYRGFRALRQRPLWKDRVDGGCAFLEVKIGRLSGQWHPHLHVLVQGRFIPQEALREEWLHCTGDSHVVDIRLVRTTDDVLYYVTKYVTKVADLNSESEITASDDTPILKEGRLVEAMIALKGRRRLITFGEWRAWKLLRAEPLGEWEIYMHEFELVTQAGNDDPLARNVLAALEVLRDSRDDVFVVPDTS